MKKNRIRKLLALLLALCLLLGGVAALAEETGGEELISNYPTHQAGRLQPYEARVLYREKG